MRSDQDHSGKEPRRNSSMPIPGMPYGMHADSHPETSKEHKQGIEFIESTPIPRQRDAAGPVYDPWEALGWGGSDATPAEDADAGLLREEYDPVVYDPAPMPRQDTHTAEYEPYSAYKQNGPYGQPYGAARQNKSYEEQENHGDYPPYTPYADTADVPVFYPPVDTDAEPEAYPDTAAYPPLEDMQKPGAYSNAMFYPPVEDEQEPEYVPGGSYQNPEKHADTMEYAAGGYREPEPYADSAMYPPVPDLEEQQGNPATPPPKKQRQRHGTEPWRLAIVLSCIVGLLFCGIEIYRVTQNVMQSEKELNSYREIYLKENNVPLSRHAQAVALRPAGETYPPTASPVPVVTHTPKPRIDMKDPLAVVMNEGGLDPSQTVAPSVPTPVIRSRLERYPGNPLLEISNAVSVLKEENTDSVGRLIISGILNEIVVQRNNTYYLNHNAMGMRSDYSAVFADENLSFRYPPENILLYGRTSYEGKAFAPLKNYIAQGFDFARRYAFLSFNHLYEDARYVIVAIVLADSNPTSPDYFDYRKLTFETDAQMLAFVEGAKARSVYNFNVPVAGSDRLLTLVTLSDGTDTENMIILCRMLREGESDGVIHAQ